MLRDTTSWDEIVKALGYEHLRRHDLRHTGLTWMADAGSSGPRPSKIAGHGSLTTTQRYLPPGMSTVSGVSVKSKVWAASLRPAWPAAGRTCAAVRRVRRGQAMIYESSCGRTAKTSFSIYLNFA